MSEALFKTDNSETAVVLIFHNVRTTMHACHLRLITALNLQCFLFATQFWKLLYVYINWIIALQSFISTAK